jgi:hypothetical protein
MLHCVYGSPAPRWSHHADWEKSAGVPHPENRALSRRLALNVLAIGRSQTVARQMADHAGRMVRWDCRATEMGTAAG